MRCVRSGVKRTQKRRIGLPTQRTGLPEIWVWRTAWLSLAFHRNRTDCSPQSAPISALCQPFLRAKPHQVKMAAEDEKKSSASSDGASSSGAHWRPTSTGSMILLSSVFAATILSGFALTVRSSRREGEPSLPPSAERPSRMALRALGLGTLAAMVGTGALCASLAYALGIKEVGFQQAVLFITAIATWVQWNK